MAHHSRLSSIVIDCHTDHVEHAAGFWSEALGVPAEVDEAHNSATLLTSNSSMAMVIQAVGGDSRVHLDIETDDLQAEVRRLEKLGAKKRGVQDHSVIMEAPTGHNFRVMVAHRGLQPRAGIKWEDR